MSAHLDITLDASADFEARWQPALHAGLTAAGYVYANTVKRALAGGYTSGDFVTGRVMNSVTVSEPEGNEVDVGTDVDYALFWEMGHHNLFTRKFERVEIWRPAIDAMGEEMSDVFAGTVLSWLVQGAPP